MTERTAPEEVCSTQYRKLRRWTVAHKVVAGIAVAMVATGCGVIGGEREPDPGISASAASAEQTTPEDPPEEATAEDPAEQATPADAIGITESEDEVTDSPEVSTSIPEGQDSGLLPEAEPGPPPPWLAACGLNAGENPREELVDSAIACLDFYQNGTVGVIDFAGLLAEEANELVGFLEDHLRYLTGGLVQPEFVLIPANDAALAGLEERTLGDCAEGDPSWVADGTMPLTNINKMIALTSLPDCAGALGSAIPWGDFRVSDVFQAMDDSGHLKPHTYGTSLHEFLHLLGVTHTGGSIGLDNFFQPFEDWAEDQDGTIVLRDYLAGLPYYMYTRQAGIGESAVMGSGANLYIDVLSAREMYHFQLPHRVLDELPESGQLIAMDDLKSIGHVKYGKVDVGHKFAQYRVPRSFTLTPEDGPESVAFKFLVFTPADDLHTGQLGLNVGLAAEDGTYATIWRIPGDADFELVVAGNLAMRIVKDGETISITVRR